MGQFNWLEETAKQWDKQVDSWSSRSKNMWDKGSRKDIIPFIEKYLKSGAKFCDFGCGDGYGAWKLAKAGYHITGIDVSREMIERAKERVQGTSIHFETGNISALRFSDDEFDGVMAINSLEWTESPLTVLNEMKRIVKPGKFAIIGILGPTAGPRLNSFQRLYGNKIVCNTMMPWEFEKLAEENGWEKIDEFGVYKQGVESAQVETLTNELKQALSFMWVFALKNRK
ncbi:class I SAM-dependent methyltransferase [Bacillus aquiflavi]|uniref:Class I SAM-dependent methyltransferase n=1 Tax=Bacillus aquiflavi TaxID=2672567 RepID=A0A6B3VYV5_9BACI|nr:class I SAM-dependent methyltransferase [Bacillus aquiflavi]MBA4536181.1 class I SAM-dependent methyltransferase [Bacillus aquiflavi]NEY80554.1 class I SAM-dependent methyltransferase [Bacillus aquiflavi]UAC46982.1 class I SAM-dependent methyltransferase [Bacillus aquiflavi]